MSACRFRFTPFAAVACANSINIPMMRSSEIQNGVPVFTAEGERVGSSSKAAKSAIAQVLLFVMLVAAGSFVFLYFLITGCI